MQTRTPPFDLPPELARDLRAFKELKEMRRRLASERGARAENGREAERPEKADVIRLTRALMAMIGELRRDRDALREKLDERERMDKMHGKYVDLASFAEAFSRAHRDADGTARGLGPSARRERRRERQRDVDAARAERMAWALRS